MPLNLTKISFRSRSVESLTKWLDGHDSEAVLTTRYLPKRHEEMAGGSLYWIIEHALVGRSLILGFEQRPDGRWHIRLEPKLVRVQTVPRRAHQGWRYLDEKDAPADLDALGGDSDVLPPRLVGELARLGLV
ncbi:MAG: DUF1489 domain-containing protein [Sphingomonadaceae bacterium]|nr:DUF1489 domain-containing protein [Sphingomonadaceae bacterium]